MGWTQFEKFDHTDPKNLERVDSRSMTIQGEATSISDLIAKYQAGATIPRNKAHFVDADIDSIDSLHRNNVDLTDLDRARKFVDKAINEIESYKPEPPTPPES